MKIDAEICSGSVCSSLAAKRGGATRIELCSALSLGGLTPSYSEVEYAVNELELNVFLLIRPRPGDFTYSKAEQQIMLQDIGNYAKLGIKGVVIGALDNRSNIDKEFCLPLVQLARSHNLSVTFHRAIDRSANILEALEEVIELGVDRVLTSGGAQNVWEGRDMLAKMVAQAADRVSIMPGGGVTANNIVELVEITKVKEIHFSASQPIISHLGSDYYYAQTSDKMVAEMLTLLKKYYL